MKKKLLDKRQVLPTPVRVQTKGVESHAPHPMLAADSEPVVPAGVSVHDFGQVRIASAGPSPPGVIQRQTAPGKNMAFYQSQSNYCQDTSFTGQLHHVNKDKACFREFSLNRKDQKGCPPSHHICFDLKTGQVLDEHTDKVGSMKGKDAKGFCETDRSCGFKHFMQEAVPSFLPDGMGPYEKDKNGEKKLIGITLPGESESRNTDLF